MMYRDQDGVFAESQDAQSGGWETVALPGTTAGAEKPVGVISTSGPFINEFHYDDVGLDTSEFVEIAARAGTNLTGFRVFFYDASGVVRFTTPALSTASVPDQSNGFGTVAIGLPTESVPNGTGALALVDGAGNLLEFLSYGGIVTATGGPAAGRTSTNVGATEADTTADSASIARVGQGNRGADFSFVNTSINSSNNVNQGQTFTTSPPAPTPPPPPPPPPSGTSFSISDASVTEGNPGTNVPLIFTITRSSSFGTGSVFYQFGDGPAPTAGPDDFVSGTPFSGTVNFADGQTSATITVFVQGDTTVEGNENTTVTLSNPRSDGVVATIADGTGIGTIFNDDTAPPPPPSGVTFSISDASVTEGNSGTSAPLTFTITRTSGVGTASVSYGPSNPPSPPNADPSDFVAGTPLSGTVNFVNGQTTATITLLVQGDNAPEGDEGIAILLSNPIGGTIADGQGIGTIFNDDGAPPPPPPSGSIFAISDASQLEPDPGSTQPITFLVSRSSNVGTASVSYSFGSGSMTTTDDFAPGTQFSGTINFADGQTSTILTFQIQGDDTVEPDEQFAVVLSNPVNGTIGDGFGLGTIRNDDSAPPTGGAFSVSDARVVEGDPGNNVPITFTITRSSGVGTASVSYFTGNGPAPSTTVADFTNTSPFSGTVNFVDGQTSATVTLFVQGEDLDEPDENAMITLERPVNGTIADGQGILTIVNDDGATPGDDVLIGTPGNDTINGLGGNDTINGLGGNDRIDGGTGNDRIDAGAGNDVAGGNDGDDVVGGGDGEDTLFGDAGSDTLFGDAGSDRLDGGTGNDRLDGGADNDIVGGGEGDDIVGGNTGDDTLYGDAGSDTLFGDAGNDRLTGGTGDDRIFGGTGDDVAVFNVTTDGADIVDLGDGSDVVSVSGNAGQIRLTFTSAGVGNSNANDTSVPNGDGFLNVRLQAENGNDGLTGPVSRFDDEGITFVGGDGQTFDVRDTGGAQRGDRFQVVVLGTAGADSLSALSAERPYYFNAGAGDDVITGGNANDFLVGGGGNDILGGGAGNDSFLGGAGSDTLYGDAGADVLDGGTGDDRLDGGEGNDIVGGGDGNDIVGGNTGDDLIYGDAGDDELFGDAGNDVLDGGVGNDVVSGGDGDDVAGGNAGADRVFGNAGNDTLYGDAGNDVLDGGSGNDRLDGGADNDIVGGGEGDDIVGGNTGDDAVYGDAGSDLLFGDAGNDRLFGGTDNDVLVGGAGADRLEGGAGADIFRFGSASESTSTGFDTLVDFNLAEGDRIDLPVAVGRIDDRASGTLSTATFDADLSTALGGLGSGEAALFDATGGEFAGRTFLIVDGNGTAGYQAGEDYVFLLQTPPAVDLTPAVFV